MEKKILKKRYIILITLILLFSCKNKKSQDVMLHFISAELNVPTFYFKSYHPSTTLKIIYTLRIINHNEDKIDINNLLYERVNGTFRKLKTRNLNYNNSLGKDTMYIDYISSKCDMFKLNVDSIIEYKKIVFKLAIQNELFYKDKSSFIKISIDPNIKYQFHTVDNNARWYVPRFCPDSFLINKDKE